MADIDRSSADLDSPAQHAFTRSGLRIVPAGTVLFREGDQPGPMYVVRAGVLRVLRGLAAQGNAVEVARISRGGLVGELSTILNQPRTATVEALTRCELVALTPESMRTLAASNESFARTIVDNVETRARLSRRKLLAQARTNDFDLIGVDEPLDEAAEPPAPLTVPEHDAVRTYLHEVACPVCSTTFFAIQYRADHDRPTRTESDFHRLYATATCPYDYAIRVCPACLYAALPSDFDTIAEDVRPRVPDIVNDMVSEQWGGLRPDFNVDRTRALRAQALELALALYAVRGAAPQRLAGLHHQLAWCAREDGDPERERRWLVGALGSYRATLDEVGDETPREELRLTYLCGDLALRTGAADEAIAWFWHVARHPKIKQFPVWERMARGRWEDARELKHRPAGAVADQPSAG